VVAQRPDFHGSERAYVAFPSASGALSVFPLAFAAETAAVVSKAGSPN